MRNIDAFLFGVFIAVFLLFGLNVLYEAVVDHSAIASGIIILMSGLAASLVNSYLNFRDEENSKNKTP